MQRRSGGRWAALGFLGLSVGAALGATLVVGVVVRQLQDELRSIPEEETVAMMVASRDLWPGGTISSADLALVELPAGFVPDLAKREPYEVVGRVPRERILAFEPIREERLADPESGVGMNAIIPRGMRALSIDVSGGAAVSGFLIPGNYVDVVVTLPGKDGREAETVTLIQAATVLAVERRLGGIEADEVDGRVKPSVTLALTPDLAERLAHAIAQGRVTLVLRSDIDVTHIESHGARTGELLGTP